MERSALLLIEYQNEWLSENGKLNHLFCDRKQYALSLMNAEKVLQTARTIAMPIIHSGLDFSPNYKEIGQSRYGLRATIPQHETFSSDSFGSQFSPAFAPRDKEFITKGRVGSSAFSGSNLDIYLRNNRIQSLYIMGYALHVCVESTLRAAHDLGYEVTVIDDACSAFTEEQRTHFLGHIVHHFGHNIKSEDFITWAQQKRR